MTTVLNLYGGPGTGKSTSAASLYAMLKQQGVNSELVREYVKDWAWEGRKMSAYDQLYFLGKQIRRESMLYDKVDTIVTDSPVLLSVYYAQRFAPLPIARGVLEATLGYYQQAKEDGHRHVHVFLKRSKPYNPAGRFQTEEEAHVIDRELRALLLSTLGFSFLECETNDEALRNLLQEVGHG